MRSLYSEESLNPIALMDTQRNVRLLTSLDTQWKHSVTDDDEVTTRAMVMEEEYMTISLDKEDYYDY